MQLYYLLVLGIASATEEFNSANKLFTADIYKQVASTEDGNFLVSPFSASAILALTQSGAIGESGQELRRVLHFSNDSEVVDKTVNAVLQKIKNSDLYTLQSANKLYVKDGLELKPEFKQKALKLYDADAESVDFKHNVEAVQKINTWVEEQTNNKINNLLRSTDIDELTRAVLINALFFKANWSTPFGLAQTREIPFHKSDKESVKIDALIQRGHNFNYYESSDLDAKFLQLPFKGEGASLIVVLPNKPNGLADLQERLQEVLASEQHLTSEYLHVVLPKFKFETTIDVKRVLENLGVKQIFNEIQADLSGIAGSKGDLYIDKVLQKTFIDVSEEGVEAAAATFIRIAVPLSARVDLPKLFVADHPFIFYIKVKDVIVFAGRVTDPKY